MTAESRSGEADGSVGEPGGGAAIGNKSRALGTRLSRGAGAEDGPSTRLPDCRRGLLRLPLLGVGINCEAGRGFTRASLFSRK